MKKLFTLFAVALISMAASAQLINFDDYTSYTTAGSLNGMTIANGDLKLTVTDTGSKQKVSSNNCYFGNRKSYKKFSSRLQTGGKSTSKNALSLSIPKEGTLKIYARTGSASDTTRTLVLVQDKDTLYNKAVKEADSVGVWMSKDTDKPTTVYKVISVYVQPGTLNISYPVNGLNFYGFELIYAEQTSLPGTANILDVDGNAATVSPVLQQMSDGTFRVSNFWGTGNKDYLTVTFQRDSDGYANVNGYQYYTINNATYSTSGYFYAYSYPNVPDGKYGNSIGWTLYDYIGRWWDFYGDAISGGELNIPYSYVFNGTSATAGSKSFTYNFKWEGTGMKDDATAVWTVENAGIAMGTDTVAAKVSYMSDGTYLINNFYGANSNDLRVSGFGGRIGGLYGSSIANSGKGSYNFAGDWYLLNTGVNDAQVYAYPYYYSFFEATQEKGEIALNMCKNDADYTSVKYSVIWPCTIKSEGVKGDVNGDGSVNISDVNAVISVMCGDKTYEATADVNGDGSVNISDVNAVITIMCGGTI